MEEHIKSNPWLGLESYQEGEILYGRDDDIRDLVQCVLNDVDTLLYGKSGIGKSSILNAGVFPAARRNGFLPVLIRFSHKDSNDYLNQIKQAIIAAMGLADKTDDEVGLQIREVVKCKDSKAETLYEYFHRHTFHDNAGNRIKLLLVFDQFEEIFTLQSDETQKRLFFAQMADLLNDIMPAGLHDTAIDSGDAKELVEVTDKNADELFDDIDFDINNDLPEYVNDNNTHFVFTIREDFLSEFEYYTSSIPSLKQNRYGLRPINEEQASQIILRPVPGLINKSVAKLIIEKVTGRSDFELDGIPEIEVDSAVLSLYMNRLFDAGANTGITAELVEQKGGQIISDFYNEAIADISPSSIVYLEDMLINGQGRRDNITVYDAVHDGGISQQELDTLCNKNKILRQFNYAGVLRIEYIHDILCPIIVERKEKREEENRINKIKEDAQKERIKGRKRLLMALSVTFALVIGIAGYFVWDWYYNIKPLKSYYAAYELRNGWPVGVGSELSESQRMRMPLYYELSHSGHKLQKFTLVKVCSSDSILDGQPVIIPMLLTQIIPADSVPAEISEMQSKIRNVKFTPTADTKTTDKNAILDNMAFYDGSNNLLFTIKYSQGENYTKWYKFYDDIGQPLPLNRDNIDRINIQTDTIGFIKSAIYYDGNGVKRPLWDDVYGYIQSETLMNRDSTEVTGMTVSTINQFSQPTEGKTNTTKIKFNKDDVTITYLHKGTGSDNITESANDYGYSRVVCSYNQHDYYIAGKESPIATMKLGRDDRGNITQAVLEDPSAMLPSMPAKTEVKYDNTGRVISKEMYGKNGTPFSPHHGVYKYLYAYSDNGETIKHVEVADTGFVYRYEREKLSDNVFAVTHGGLSRKASKIIPFHVRIDSVISATETRSYYYDINHEPVNYAGDNKMNYHKVISRKTDGVEEYAYYKNVDNELVPLNDNNTYFRIVRTFDKDGNILSYKTFNHNGDVMKSMMYIYDNGLLTGRSAQGIDNTPVRCDLWEEEGFLYYKLLFNLDFNGQYTDFMAVNEFNKPSLIRYGNDYIKIKYADFIGATLNCSNIKINPLFNIDIVKHYWQHYPQNSDNISDKSMTYIHLLDKSNILYKEGIRDGDIIDSCGSWKSGDDLGLLKRELTETDTMTILKLEGKSYIKKDVRLPRKLNVIDLKTVHLHNMNLSASEKTFNKF